MELALGTRVWHATAYTEPVVPARRPQGSSEFLDLQIESGRVRWIVVDYEPGAEKQMHHTDTADLDIVLKGSIELVLDDGVPVPGVGAGAIITGKNTAWR